MSRTYNRPQTDEEKLDMAKAKAAKAAESKERAAVGRERRLALALRAILDVTDKIEPGGNKPLDLAVEEAQQLLVELGYTGLEGIPRTLERLNAELQSAFAAGDGETISRLGRELAKTKAGKVYRKPAVEASE